MANRRQTSQPPSRPPSRPSSRNSRGVGRARSTSRSSSRPSFPADGQNFRKSWCPEQVHQRFRSLPRPPRNVPTQWDPSNDSTWKKPAVYTHCQRFIWNPAYHSIDHSRVHEGFYSVRNALGPGTRSRAISSFEAEVLCQRFAHFYHAGPFKDMPLDEALAKEAVHLYTTYEKFRRCVPDGASLGGTLVMMNSNDSFAMQKNMHQKLREHRADYFYAAYQAYDAVHSLKPYARHFITLEDIEDSGLSEADIEVARRPGALLRLCPSFLKPLKDDDFEFWECIDGRYLSLPPGTRDIMHDSSKWVKLGTDLLQYARQLQNWSHERHDKLESLINEVQRYNDEKNNAIGAFHAVWQKWLGDWLAISREARQRLEIKPVPDEKGKGPANK